MRRIKLSATAVCLLVTVNAAYAAKITGDQVVASVRKTFSALRDYRVDATMSVKGGGIGLGSMSATIYYKKPDKVHVEPKPGAFMTPPEALLANPIGDLTRGTRATYVKTQTKAGCDCYVVKLTAKDRPALHLWVDRKRSVIVATETSGESKATSIWRYKMVDGKYCVPVAVTATMRAPKGLSGTSAQTSMTVRFSNYIINKGISDKVFEHKPRK